MGAGLSVAHGISHWVKNTTGKSRATVANNASKDNELKKTKSSSYAIEKKVSTEHLSLSFCIACHTNRI